MQKKRTIWIAAAVLSCIILALIAFTAVTYQPAPEPVACEERVLVVRTSSSERSEALQNLAVSLMRDSLVAAGICKDSLLAIAVSGGGQVHQLLSTADVESLDLGDGNETIRKRKADAKVYQKAEQIARSRLSEALETSEVDHTSSVAAGFDAAAQYADGYEHLILIGDGMNQDAEVDLNKPLVEGAGQLLAAEVQMSAGIVTTNFVTMIGIGSPDSATANPNRTWINEVHSFSMALCARATGEVLKCRTLQSGPRQLVLEAPIPGLGS